MWYVIIGILGPQGQCAWLPGIEKPVEKDLQKYDL